MVTIESQVILSPELYVLKIFQWICSYGKPLWFRICESNVPCTCNRYHMTLNLDFSGVFGCQGWFINDGWQWDSVTSLVCSHLCDQFLGRERYLKTLKLMYNYNLILQASVIFIHLKMWIAAAKHNFKCVKIYIDWLRALETFSTRWFNLLLTHTCASELGPLMMYALWKSFL